MPRPECPIDSRSPIADLAIGLRALRHGAELTYEQMSGKTHFSVSVLSTAASGKKLPTWAVTIAYVTTCGDNPENWREQWETARDAWNAAKSAAT